MEELINYLFEDLDLPFMERKKFFLLETEKTSKRWGIQRRGISPRLSKKCTMMKRIKRKKASMRLKNNTGENSPEKRFPVSENDLAL